MDIWQGADRFLDDYVGVKADDQVAVIYTPDARDQAGWLMATLKARGMEVQALSMAPLQDAALPERLAGALPRPGQIRSRLVIITAERHTMSHTGAFRAQLSEYPRESWLAARIISASEEFFTHAMGIGSGELSQRNTAVLEKLMPARDIRITTDAGTDLSVQLDPDKYRWTSNRGAYRPGGFMVMPPGEVATYPASIEGVLVADGAFNMNVFTRLDARLESKPVTVKIEAGTAVGFSCDDERMRELLRLVFATPNAQRVGELGFGTNCGVPEFIAMNCHINERRPGLHLGFGQHNQSIFDVGYDCQLHMDLICDGGLIHVDDTIIDLKNLVPSDRPHPRLVMDEDIDGDCCGLWVDDLRECNVIPRGTPPASPW